jgi:LuxR family transcriptional regulator, maltose regulon positive regulatory protein
MPAQRLLAKLTRPRLHGAVSRERLFSCLDEARGQRPTICVVGPPGAGKTTLVASWLDERGAKGVWYQVDPGDADLATFFHYLGQAAVPYARKGQPTLPALTPEYRQDIAGFSRRFFRELFSRLPEDAVVVLDNYQEVGADQPFHALIAQAVDEVPPGMVLVAVSRRDPPDTYARLIANEHVALVDWDQLKLTLDEATAIATARVDLAAPEIERLHATCGGWAAGLTLLIEGRRRNSATSADLPEGRDAIFDYFAAQIFARVPAATQRFLVATALLPQVPVSVARELTGNADAEAILDDLYRRHLFTHRRAGREPVYWYHALFRAFLAARTSTVLGTAATLELLSRAARLLEASGSFDDAFELFREAADWQAAGRLIERRASDLLAHGRGQTLREWIQHLPLQMLESHPWLCYWLGTSLIPVDQPAARQRLEQAFDLFGTAGHPTGQALCAGGIIDAYFFEWTDFRQMRRWVDALDALIDRAELADNPKWEQRINSSMILGILYVAPDHPRLTRSVQRVTEMLDEDLDDNSKLAAAMMLLSYCNLTGDLVRATRAAARGGTLVRNSEVTPFARMWWHLRYSYYLTIFGDYEQATAELDGAESIAETHGFHRLSTNTALIASYRTLTRACMGDHAGARRAHDKIASVQDDRRPMSRWHTVESRVICELAADNLQMVAEIGPRCIALSEAVGMTYIQLLTRGHYAIALAGSGQREALAEQIAIIRTMSRGTCFRQFDYHARLLESWDELAHGDRDRARALLAEALGTFRFDEQPFAHIFRGTRLFRELMAEACDAGIAVEQVNIVIRRFRLAAPAVASDRWPWPVRVRTLGAFQVEVDGVPLQFVGKTPRKPLALLKALVSLGTHSVPAAALIDALWPGEEGDAARKSLDVTIARLRKLLGRSEAVLVSDESVGLNRALCWVDASSFAESPDGGPAREATLAKYAGTFLPGDLDVSWTLKRREQLRSRFVRLVVAAGAAAEAESDWDVAIACYRRGLDADELAETFHQGLMRCHLAAGRYAEGMAAYRRLRQTLSVLLGISPSAQSQALARTLQQEGAARDATG